MQSRRALVFAKHTCVEPCTCRRGGATGPGSGVLPFILPAVRAFFIQGSWAGKEIVTDQHL